MKSRVTVIKKENGFVGQLLNDEKVIYETPMCSNSMIASRALMNHVGSVSSDVSTTKSTADILTIRAKRVDNSSSNNGRKCCGRN
jgi:hypothetical protein